ncbi:MAG TPA: hypothetical protein PKY86_04065 [Niabella sp.]|nr:hypothetical protein [Niabella sp.]HQW14566.1 hypothetical protein [Niabella sp.]HQX19707.1 hypothetical protein [Niabella sp.]HQX42762.1 hypothetical protein [Niabella sp.]HRB07556.1 hypothetical protein [Niabella sp.]
MKLAPVLLKYLAINKELELPGIGSFVAENNVDPETLQNKKESISLDIRFEQKKITSLDDKLIDFVSKETGKMRVLAESDLNSQLTGVLDFINTGKPYFLPGIGTLTKKMNSKFEFHKEKFQHIDKPKTIPKTEKNIVPQAFIDENNKRIKAKPVIIILVFCLLAIAASVWFYLKNTHKESQKVEDITAITEPAEQTKEDTTSQSNLREMPQTVANSSPEFYKYVLELAKQPRASKRFNQLKSLKWPVEMETSDSSNYSIFIKLPVANSDTIRIKDSLSVLSGKKVWISK